MKKKTSKKPEMIDVSEKTVTRRTARVEAVVVFPKTIDPYLVTNDILSRKGSVFQTASLAGVMAAKQTSTLIPLCHPIAIENCSVELDLNRKARTVRIECAVVAHHKTGVEMEAFCGASVAALTVYDMCKGLARGIVIRKVRLLEKRGGKSDYVVR